MSVGPCPPISVPVRWAQEWQRLTLAATNRALGRYLHGCAHVVMAHTPQQALAAQHKMHAGLLGHAVDTIAEATELWRKQNAELLRL